MKAPVSIELKKYPAITATTDINPSSSSITITLSTFSQTLYHIWSEKINTIDGTGIAVKRLNELKLDNGFMNLYPYSYTLLNEYQSNHEPQLLYYARMLSPSLSEPYFELSYYALTNKKAVNEKPLVELSMGINSFFRDPYNILRFASNRLINIAISIVIVLFIFSILMIARYYPQIYASLRTYLPEYIPGYAVILFLIVVMLLPVLSGIGFLWLLILWFGITFAYQKLTERLVSIGFIIFVGMLTFISLLIVATILKPAEQPFTGMMNIYYGNVSSNDINDLKVYADKYPADLYSNLYLGVYYKRIGDYQKASFYYRRLTDNGYGNLPEVICDMGNLEYATGNVNGAENNYKKAISVAPDFFPARYNLGQLYIIQGNIDGTEELDIAKNINPTMFGYYASIYQKSNINRIFVDALPEPAALAYNMFLTTIHSPTALALSDTIVNTLIKWPPAGQLPYLGLWLLLSFMVIGLLSRFVKTSFRCKTCGKLYKPLNREDEYREQLCGDCYKFYVKNDIKENERKAEITRRVWKWKKKLRILNIALSLLVPGSGYIIRGQTIRGIIILSIIFYLIIEYVTSFGLIPSIFPTFNPYLNMIKIGIVLTIIMIYVLNVILAFKVEPKWY